MAATIRLMRFGKKGYAVYRIVVLDKRKKRDGSYIESIGFYDPMQEPAVLKIEKERFNFWQERGAQLSEGLQRLIKRIKKD